MIEVELKELLEKKFPNADIAVENQSHLHEGHASSPNSGQSHFKVSITSNKFEQKTRLQRHKMVNNVVKPLFDKGLHALSLSLNTPQK